MEHDASPIDDMIAAFGSLRALGKGVGVSGQTILNWKRTGVPEWRVLDLERATGCPRNRIRPDLYASPDALSPWDVLRAQGAKMQTVRQSKRA